MTLYSLECADVSLRIYSLSLSLSQTHWPITSPRPMNITHLLMHIHQTSVTHPHTVISYVSMILARDYLVSE